VPSEHRHVIESASAGYLSDAEAGGLQHPLRQANLLRDQPAVRCRSGLGPELAIESAAAHRRHRGQPIRVRPFGEVT